MLPLSAIWRWNLATCLLWPSTFDEPARGLDEESPIHWPEEYDYEEPTGEDDDFEPETPALSARPRKRSCPWKWPWESLHVKVSQDARAHGQMPALSCTFQFTVHKIVDFQKWTKLCHQNVGFVQHHVLQSTGPFFCGQPTERLYRQVMGQMPFMYSCCLAAGLPRETEKFATGDQKTKKKKQLRCKSQNFYSFCSVVCCLSVWCWFFFYNKTHVESWMISRLQPDQCVGPVPGLRSVRLHHVLFNGLHLGLCVWMFQVMNYITISIL